jgi:hypothetical protein
MANVLSTDKQVAIISALAEGSAIRQIERITGVHLDNPKHPRRHVTVLHIAPVLSAEAAVKAAIVQEFRSLEPAD